MQIIHTISIIVSVFLMLIILWLVYKRMLREEYSLLWLIGGIILVVLSLSRGLLKSITERLEIAYPPSLIFAVGILFVTGIVLSQAVSITTLIQRDRELTQKTAILEWRIEQLLEKIAEKMDSGDHVDEHSDIKRLLY